jgi:cytochrome c553
MSRGEPRLHRAGGLAFAALLLASATALAQDPSSMSERERQRRQLIERLGIEEPPSPPAPPKQAGTPDAGVAPPVEASAPPVKEPGKPAHPTAAPPKQRRVPSYVEDVRPALQPKCGTCHGSQGKASKTRWVLTEDAHASYDATLRFIDQAAPEKSRLLAKATAEVRHSPGKIFETGSPEYALVLAWIQGGARFSQGNAPPPEPPAPVAAAQRPASGAHSGTSAQPSAPAPGPQQPPLPVASSAQTPPAPAQPPQETAQAPSRAPAAPAATGVPFIPAVHEALTASCSGCHSPGSMADGSRYIIPSDPQRHFEAARALVKPGSAEDSLLYRRARGDDHSAGAVWEQGSQELALLGAWINGGAEATASAPQPTAQGPAQPPSVATVPPVATAPPAASPHGERGGFELGTLPGLGAFRLNGRFDLNYERRGYNDNPFQSGTTQALRSYHQFLFLTRQSAEDPVTATLELISLQFWEIGMRVSPKDWPVHVSLKLGKLLVPFGAEPLFHHSYGGLAGFDQRVNPVVWAREGICANARGRWRGFVLSADAYLVSGYRLRRAEDSLNLQSDFAPLDEARLGLGARLGASWGPLSVWYSPYFNTLGFGRRLFLQALDVAVWRPRELPVLSHFSLGVGLLRADVSGGASEGFGGPGADYYHFASYVQLRYYPRDWLYVQYRQGLRTFTNRRGVLLDKTDLTPEDGSSHNIGVVARWRGLSAGLYHFWNLEKVDEVPDDFLRLGVTFEF